MAKLLRLRRGTTTQHGSFTGAEGEVTVDTDKDTLVVHDNATAGGRPLLREDLNNMPASGVTAGTYGSSSAIPAITVDAKGRVTSATTSAIDSTSIANGTSNVSVAASGDITVTRAGATVGQFLSTGVHVNDSIKFTAGTHQDLEVFHDGTHSYIKDEGTGGLRVTTNGTDIALQKGITENLAKFIVDGACELYHDSSLKLTTTSTGIDVTGTVACDGFDSQGNGSINGNLTVNGQVTVGNGQNSSTIVMADGDEGARNIHCNSNFIGFLTAAQGWGPRADDDGHWVPGGNNAQDLGSSSLQWRDGYFDGTVNCDGLSCVGDALVSSSTGILSLRDNDSSGNATLCFIRGQNNNGAQRWAVGQITTGNEYVYLRNDAAAGFQFHVNGSDVCFISESGHFIPNQNNTFDLGTSSYRWRNLYTNDLNLSNEGGTNDVDGTWGSWTIQEGEDDLFLLNRRNGKKYKFNLSEVS